MYPHVIKRWNLSWCNTQNAGIVKHGVMGDKRKIRTPKVRESFFKPMNILGLNGNSINALTYSTITHFQETKFNLKRYQFKNLTSTIPWTKWFQNKNKNREFTISYFFHYGKIRNGKNIHFLTCNMFAIWYEKSVCTGAPSVNVYLIAFVMFQINNSISNWLRSWETSIKREKVVNICQDSLFWDIPSLFWKHFSNKNEVISPRSKSEEGGELSINHHHAELAHAYCY